MRMGSRPTIHRIDPSQATQETLRSSSLMPIESGIVARSTRATSRITTSDSSTGMTTRNSATGSPSSGISRRAPSASSSAMTGNSTPSYTRWPSSTDWWPGAAVTCLLMR